MALRDVVARASFPLDVATSANARRTASATVGQLDDYLLPRVSRLDAPLLVVVGGSTGAGKSTLINSLVGSNVSASSILRPTTRGPVLVCNPADADWFRAAELLPNLRRTTGAPDPESVQIVESDALAEGLALLDAPDIDSVVETNRALAEQLLAAADLWLFVTTAARYADAVPWDFLATAQVRGTAIALVLDRVPVGGGDTVAPHLLEMLRAHGLDDAPLFVVEELPTEEGFLPLVAVGDVGRWLASLAESAAARAAVIRRTVDGAVVALDPTARRLAADAQDQIDAAAALTSSVEGSYRAAEDAVAHGVRDGTLLRGEVLARWQELVGTGEFMRGLQARIGRARDRAIATVTGRPAAAEKFEHAIESGLVTLVRGSAADAEDRVRDAWRAHPAGTALAPEVTGDAVEAGSEFSERVERMVRDWQRELLDLVRVEAGDKRKMARVGAYAVNALSLSVMIAVFTATAFIPTGAEIAVAGGTTIAGQKVLEAIFGDQVVRQLAEQARGRLMEHVRDLLEQDAARFIAVVERTGLDRELPLALRRAADDLREARSQTWLPEPELHGATR